MPARRTHSPGEALRTALFVAFISALVGGYVGFTESLVLIATGSDVMTARAAVNVAVLYGLMFGCLGLGIGLVVLVVDALSGWRVRLERARALLGSMVAALAVLLILVGYANELFLPKMISPRALAVDAALLVACALFGWFLYRRILSRQRTSAARGWLRSPLVWSSLGLVLVLIVVGALASGPGSGGSSPAGRGESKDLNVLLLVIDALRSDHLGSYGYERNTSPNLDKLAAEGVRFTNAYAQGSRTKETTASIVTSLYASSHNVSSTASALPVSSPTLMSEMRAAGYRTGVFSANPLVSPLFGFDRSVDYFYSNTPIAERLAILPVTFRKPRLRLGRLLAFERRLEALFPLELERVPFTGDAADALNSEFLDWLDSEPDAGFFAYIHYMEPHIPYAPPPPFDRLFDPTYEGERLTEPPVRHGLPAVLHSEKSELPPREFTNLIAQYDGAIAFADHEVERLKGELRSRGLAGNTLIVVTADHGEELYDRGGWLHGHTVHDELVRVPLIVWCPSRVPGGRVVEGVTRHVDIMPTILAAAGATADSGAVWYEGVDIWPFLSGGSAPPTGLPALSEVRRAGASARSLRIGDLKLIQVLRGSDEELMLFDIAADPGELNDLSVERPEVLQSMKQTLEQMITDSIAKGAASEMETIDEETRERLESLGYVL